MTTTTNPNPNPNPNPTVTEPTNTNQSKKSKTRKRGKRPIRVLERKAKKAAKESKKAAEKKKALERKKFIRMNRPQEGVTHVPDENGQIVPIDEVVIFDVEMVQREESEEIKSWQDCNEVGRNDSCPCGSGLKYKRCCQAIHEVQRQEFNLSIAQTLNNFVTFVREDESLICRLPIKSVDEEGAYLTCDVPISYEGSWRESENEWVSDFSEDEDIKLKIVLTQEQHDLLAIAAIPYHIYQMIYIEGESHEQAAKRTVDALNAGEVHIGIARSEFWLEKAKRALELSKSNETHRLTSDFDYVRADLEIFKASSEHPFHKTTCGIDIDSKYFVCSAMVGIAGTDQVRTYTRTFPRAQVGYLEFIMWLQIFPNMTKVAMESTGTYYTPLYQVLTEKTAYDVVVLNPYFLKFFEKTDVLDSIHIAWVVYWNKVRESSMVEGLQKEARYFTREMQRVTDMRAKMKNKIKSLLTGVGFTFQDYMDISKKSGRMALSHIISGNVDVKDLMQCYTGNKYKNDPDKIRQMFTCATNPTEAQKMLLESFLNIYDNLDRWVTEYKKAAMSFISQMTIERADLGGKTLTGKDYYDLIKTVPGLGPKVAMVLIAECGLNIFRFKSEAAFVRFAGGAPHVMITGGKEVKKTKSDPGKKGNTWIARAMKEVSKVAVQFGNAGWFSEVAREYMRKPNGMLPKAVKKISGEYLKTVYQMLTRWQPYKERDSAPKKRYVKSVVTNFEKALDKIQELDEQDVVSSLGDELKELTGKIAQARGLSERLLTMGTQFQIKSIEECNFLPKILITTLKANKINSTVELLPYLLMDSNRAIKTLKGYGGKRFESLINMMLENEYIQSI